MNTSAINSGILDATYNLFFEGEIQNISIQEISKKSGISADEIISIYPSLDDITRTLAERSIVTLKKEGLELAKGKGLEKLRQLISHDILFFYRVEVERILLTEQTMEGHKSALRLFDNYFNTEMPEIYYEFLNNNQELLPSKYIDINFYAHFTIKNLLFQNHNLYNEFESNNQRKYLASAGYIIDLKRKVSLEPSFLFQLSEFTKEKLMDINIKGYYPIREGRLWAGLSYRRSFEGAQYYKADVVASQKLQMITSIVGIDIKNFVFAYNYSKPIGDISFGNGGFHQITLGFNFLRGNNGYYYIRGIL